MPGTGAALRETETRNTGSEPLWFRLCDKDQATVTTEVLFHLPYPPFFLSSTWLPPSSFVGIQYGEVEGEYFKTTCVYVYVFLYV